MTPTPDAAGVQPEELPYGTWPSTIGVEDVVSQGLRLGEVRMDRGRIYWTEGRPWEKGRTVLMSATEAGDVREEVLSEMNVRTRVHEYGGGAFQVDEGSLYFCNYQDQQIYMRVGQRGFRALTQAPESRFADLQTDRSHNRLLAVRENHAASQVENNLVGIDLGEGTLETLASGHDFYASPALNPEGTRLAYLAWDHPHMPWDGTRLLVSEIDDQGRQQNTRQIAGGDRESIVQPLWTPGGELLFISDRSGWWNLYSWDGSEVASLLPLEAEFGRPQWVFGRSTLAVLADGRILAIGRKDSRDRLYLLDPKQGDLQEIETPWQTLGQLRVRGGLAALRAGGPDRSSAILRLDLDLMNWTVVRQAREIQPLQGTLSLPRSMCVSVEERDVHLLYYPPQNPRCLGLEDEKPPLIVKSHGGPTSEALPDLNMEIQFWTSRGFAVADVNYSGSTGYGREYRERLIGQWGILDVQDCEGVARALAHQGLVDPDRLIIRGGSAGGYTTLCALTFGDTFQTGASYYGVSDLEILATDTHKFESRYLNSLVGPYPQDREIYAQRSPIRHTDLVKKPIIFFQGADDPVVPPSQAEIMVNALQEAGLPVTYLLFQGESHGFRQSETIIRALRAELNFYGKIFGFEPSDPDPDLHIVNL